MQLTAVPSPSKCFFTGITTLGELFQKGDGGPSSELIIARKNKLQPYFPVSLIYKGFFFYCHLFACFPLAWQSLPSSARWEEGSHYFALELGVAFP